MALCSHEDVDTQIFEHARHATEASSTIIVIAVNVLQELQELGLQQLRVALVKDRTRGPVYDLCCTLTEKSKRMLFHAFTGCDVFSKRSQDPPVVDGEDLEALEKFVVMMYDRPGTAEGVDDARLDMFVRQQMLHEAIPPRTGVGPRKEICGRSFGQSSHPLQRVASSWPSVDASRNTAVNANATGLV